jgi:hypothetical protein
MSDQSSVDLLIAQFPRHLAYYEATPPFNKPEQLRTHRKTIALRRELGTASAALADDQFLNSLAQTLKAWGIWSRGSIPGEALEFRRQLRNHEGEIAMLEGALIDSVDEQTCDRLWRIIRSLNLVLDKRTLEPTQSKVVSGSKALHHLLPDLMPPIDRTYTGVFFDRWQPHHFQNRAQEEKTFRIAFKSFGTIAANVNPVQYVGTHEWNTSRTKVIDNAIVGFVRFLKDRGKRPPP